MKDFLSSGGRTSVQISKMDDTENSAVWTTKKVDQLLADFENGLIDIKTIKNSPFKDNDPAWKKPNLVFEYTPEELEEIKNLTETPEKFCESKEVKTHKQPKEFKEVLNKQNSSATRKPKDFNDKQNLTEFNHGTYRDEKGRFKSKKKWNKELKTS